MQYSNSISTLSRESLETKFKPLLKFFTDGIKDLYWAEKAIEPVLKKNKSLALTDELADALEDHEIQTQKHVLRLEKIFQKLNIKPETKKCEAAAGIIKEADEIIGATPEKSMTRDAVIIIAMQKMEHYEIASYGGLLQIALTFNMNQVADLLEKTLNEEEDADLHLTDIAESYINLEAAEESNTESTGKDNDEQANADKKLRSEKAQA
ncbi:YciE/YciF ferroxidase family protein [Polluticaenibacter yanchengensis]|uniref:DUF892 family protein n=1 Tax=Polluticaenibacter yanchengensis TaxID=3014562 RepID=A0ABT4UJU7_9BACT|nr:DUF892 family protein [Chitinophagaceae bacterium LY-5]